MNAPNLVTLGLIVLLAGCVGTTTVIKANATPAVQAEQGLTPDLLMDVGITPFDPGIPDSEKELEKGLIVPDVRLAESGYLAYHLKDTMESTGNWGAVRVTPVESAAVELVITGEILISDGEQIKARVKAVDSTGRTWINKVYEDTASKFSYKNQGREDPFQDFYNDVANDLLAYQQTLTPEERQRTRRVTALKFAASFAPQAFDDYMEEGSRGKMEVVRLPDEDDPMLARVEKIKEREYLIVDTLDDFYGRFYTDMQPSYFLWRESTYQEAIDLRDARRDARKKMLGGAALIAGGIAASTKSKTWAGQAAASGAVGGGIGSIYAGINKQKQVKVLADAMKETSSSLGAELTPIVLDIEGKTVELTGSAAAQYDEWRKILREIYSEETGLGPE